MAIAFVQAGAWNGSAVAMGSAQTAGNTNIIVVTTWGTTATPANVGDNIGGTPQNTYTLIGNTTPDPTFGTVYLYIATGIKANAAGAVLLNSITVTSGTVQSEFFEYSGVSSTKDGTIQTGSGTTGTAMAHANLTTTASTNDLVISVGVNGSASSFTQGSGYTGRWTQSSMAAYYEDQIITNSTGPFTGTMTASGSGHWVVLGVALKASAPAAVSPVLTGSIGVTGTQSAELAVVPPALSGNIGVSGVLVPTLQGANYPVLSGNVGVSGVLNVQLQANVSGSGVAGVQGVLAPTLGLSPPPLSGQVSVGGTLVTNLAASPVLSGNVRVTGTLVALVGVAFTGTGRIGVSGTLRLAFSPAQVRLSGSIGVSGALSVTLSGPPVPPGPPSIAKDGYPGDFLSGGW